MGPMAEGMLEMIYSDTNSGPEECERFLPLETNKHCNPILVRFRLLHSIRYLNEIRDRFVPRELVSLREEMNLRGTNLEITINE